MSAKYSDFGMNVAAVLFVFVHLVFGEDTKYFAKL